MNIRALETHYAGCRFRSRLEARYAVFFDSLGVRWEYEPEGYLIGPYYGPDSDTATADLRQQRPYLPDFWLPDAQMWVEVKGSPDQMDNRLICDASMSHSGWGLPPTPYGGQYTDDTRNTRRMLILGPIPANSPWQPVHYYTAFHKGDVVLGDAAFTRTGDIDIETYYNKSWLGSDAPEYNDSIDLVSPRYVGVMADLFVRHCYSKARKARFEHGERG